MALLDDSRRSLFVQPTQRPVFQKLGSSNVRAPQLGHLHKKIMLGTASTQIQPVKTWRKGQKNEKRELNAKVLVGWTLFFFCFISFFFPPSVIEDSQGCQWRPAPGGQAFSQRSTGSASTLPGHLVFVTAPGMKQKAFRTSNAKQCEAMTCSALQRLYCFHCYPLLQWVVPRLFRIFVLHFMGQLHSIILVQAHESIGAPVTFSMKSGYEGWSSNRPIDYCGWI